MGTERALKESIEKICGIAAADIDVDSRLDDLGIDSLAVAEIIVELEIRLDRELPIQLLRHLDRVQTVGDVTGELDAALAEAGPEAVT